MNFDLCIVTYNSQNWLEGFISSLNSVNYNLKKINLFFVDNASSDDTVAKLYEIKVKYEQLYSSIDIVCSKKNNGFGRGSNIGARLGKSEYIFFINIDVEFTESTFFELEKEIISSDEDFGAFELRQFPYEHPKFYNPITLEVSCASGACLILKRDVFNITGGFDERFFMYVEDIDLSWNIRMRGYKIKYVPNSIITHYSYKEEYEEKPLQLVGSLIGNLILRYKYGTDSDIANWDSVYTDEKIKKIKKYGYYNFFEKEITKIKQQSRDLRDFYNKTLHFNFKPQFYALEYEFQRSGAFYKNKLPTKKIDISIIIRTYQRPNVLRLTLESLTKQTYKNFNVIVVEDGINRTAHAIIEEFKHKLNLEYYPVEAPYGRSKVANFGIHKAKTDFCCFLDDDDYFFAEHLEVMASLIQDNPDADMYCASAISAHTKYNKEYPEIFEYIHMDIVSRKSLCPLDFYIDNPVPIQSVVFLKEKYEMLGGINENLDALEDWDFWIRYANTAKIIYTDKTTSLYKVPYDALEYKNRRDFINSYRNEVLNNMHKINANVTPYDIYILYHFENQKKIISQSITQKTDFENEIFLKSTNLSHFMNKFGATGNIDEIRYNEDFKMLTISGWAFLNSDFKCKPKDIYIVLLSKCGCHAAKINNLTVRSDVSITLDLSNDVVGFDFSMKLDSLLNGSYQLFIYVKESDNACGFFDTKCSLEKQGSIHLQKNDEHFRCIMIERIVKYTFAFKTTTYCLDSVKVQELNLIMDGWIFIKNMDRQSQEIFIEIKGKTFKRFLTSRKLRYDIVTHFNNNLYQNSGFTLSVPLKYIDDGKNAIVIYAQNRNKKKKSRKIIIHKNDNKINLLN